MDQYIWCHLWSLAHLKWRKLWLRDFSWWWERRKCSERLKCSYNTGFRWDPTSLVSFILFALDCCIYSTRLFGTVLMFPPLRFTMAMRLCLGSKGVVWIQHILFWNVLSQLCTETTCRTRPIEHWVTSLVGATYAMTAMFSCYLVKGYDYTVRRSVSAHFRNHAEIAICRCR